MSLPTFIVLKSNYNEKYLGFAPPEEFKDIHQGVDPSRNSFLRFDRDEVSKCTKFEVQPAKTGDGLVHIKSFYNNKYWVRWSPDHRWIVAAADEPEEDQSKWSCTLFKPEYIDQEANTLRFIHLQLGHYACLWRIAPPFGGCLFAASKDRDKDSCDVVTVIDWESIPISKMLKAVVYPITSNNGVIGRINFTQQDKNTPVDIEVNISNILNGLHALHINTYGDISDGPSKTEPIFGSVICKCPPNPIGKLQDVEAKNGTVNALQTSDKLTLFEGENCIIGRAVVVHKFSSAYVDQPVAWGIIGLSPN